MLELVGLAILAYVGLLAFAVVAYGFGAVVAGLAWAINRLFPDRSPRT